MFREFLDFNFEFEVPLVDLKKIPLRDYDSVHIEEIVNLRYLVIIGNL